MNKYDVLSVVGEGAYGIVLRCRNRVSGADVAIKKFKECEDDVAVRKTTLREVRVLRLLQAHPNIVQLREAFRRKGKLYLVFEYLPRNLLEVLEAAAATAAAAAGGAAGQPPPSSSPPPAPPPPHSRGGDVDADSRTASVASDADGATGAASPPPPPPPQPPPPPPVGLPADLVRRYLFQLVLALEWCHRHGVIHRDVKPENLLVEPASQSLRLCDFGFGRVLPGPDPNGRAPCLTDYVATRWYRSPELLLGSTDYSPAVDMWAVGACARARHLTAAGIGGGAVRVTPHAPRRRHSPVSSLREALLPTVTRSRQGTRRDASVPTAGRPCPSRTSCRPPPCTPPARPPTRRLHLGGAHRRAAAVPG